MDITNNLLNCKNPVTLTPNFIFIEYSALNRYKITKSVSLLQTRLRNKHKLPVLSIQFPLNRTGNIYMRSGWNCI